MQNKLIRDSIHGYIDIPQIILVEIVDTPIFQRLRQIEQTSMRVLYPSAHHDRFVHSIGVYHLGKLAYRGLMKNIQKENIIYDNYKEFWKEYKICFHLACLLHDCGHSPMSHSFEYGYLNTNDKESVLKMKNRLINSMLVLDDYETKLSNEFINQTKHDVDEYFKNPKTITPHEMVSAILVSEYFLKNGKLEKVLKEILNRDISEQQLAEYINFMQRAIMGIPYDVSLQISEKQTEDDLKNCLISLLNGSFFDVDKLDYIIRDSVESGANNISIDVQRILSSLTLVETYNFDEMTDINNLRINNSISLKGIRGSIEKNDSGICECALNLKDVKFEGDFQGTIEFKGNGNHYETITSKGYRVDTIERVVKTTKISVIARNCRIQGQLNGSITCLERYDDNENDDVIDGVINANISGRIKGTIIGHINVKSNVQISYKIGYMKNSLSVIEDTLLARNRLYLWIYAHHKVTYNDYILRKGILYSFLDNEQQKLNEMEKNEASNKVLYSKMNIENMFLNPYKSYEYLLSDGDFINNMKCSVVDNGENNYFAKQWLNRDHQHSVWKSYAEYNSFFINLSKTEQKVLWQLLFDATSSEDKNIREANSREFSNSLLMEFNKTISEDFKCDYTWIKPAGIKLKEMKSEDIYIKFSDNSVKRMKDIILQSKISEQYADENFFYLYSSVNFSPELRLKLISFLKTKCNEMSSELN